MCKRVRRVLLCTWTARCCLQSLRKGRGCVAARVDCRPSMADTSFFPASCNVKVFSIQGQLLQSFPCHIDAYGSVRPFPTWQGMHLNHLAL